MAAPVVGRMLRTGDRRGIADFLEFVRKGPAPDLALTDPALFRSLRSAVTSAQLAGLARFRLDHRHVPRAMDRLGEEQDIRQSLSFVPAQARQVNPA